MAATAFVALGGALVGHVALDLSGDKAVLADGGLLATRGASVPPDYACQDTNACKDWGRCSLTDPACSAELSERCAKSEGCRTRGECELRGQWCRATRDADCAKSEGCLGSGRCALLNGSCRASTDAHCARSDTCRKAGDCGVFKDYCAPSKDEHCQSSEDCRSEGWCRRIFTREPSCGIGEHVDCATSVGCKKEGRCRLGPLRGQGDCVAAKLIDRKRWRLTEARHGIQGTLVLAQDPKIWRKVDESWRGYCPNDDYSLASAALQVRDRSGAVVSEAALYPDVGIQVEDLGSGTDTFRATEFIGCPGGHSSGWHTVFLEVRGGKVSRLRAIGAGAAEREIAMSATNDERWKIERKPGRCELVVQLEGSTPEPALIETHFWFENGQYRFLERKSDSYDPEIAKQSGAWHGALDFHGAEWGAPGEAK